MYLHCPKSLLPWRTEPYHLGCPGRPTGQPLALQPRSGGKEYMGAQRWEDDFEARQRCNSRLQADQDELQARNASRAGCSVLCSKPWVWIPGCVLVQTTVLTRWPNREGNAVQSSEYRDCQDRVSVRSSASALMPLWFETT